MRGIADRGPKSALASDFDFCTTTAELVGSRAPQLLVHNIDIGLTRDHPLADLIVKACWKTLFEGGFLITQAEWLAANEWFDTTLLVRFKTGRGASTTVLDFH